MFGRMWGRRARARPQIVIRRRLQCVSVAKAFENERAWQSAPQCGNHSIGVGCVSGAPWGCQCALYTRRLESLGDLPSPIAIASDIIVATIAATAKWCSFIRSFPVVGGPSMELPPTKSVIALLASRNPLSGNIIPILDIFTFLVSAARPRTVYTTRQPRPPHFPRGKCFSQSIWPRATTRASMTSWIAMPSGLVRLLRKASPMLDSRTCWAVKA